MDECNRVLPPLYNYLKPYPGHLEETFYERYGGADRLCRETASPRLGNLNAGLQLYRIKHVQPEKYARIRYALHLPQYLSFLLTGKYCSDLTSIGCHTQLWDFTRNAYHQWVSEEGLDKKLAPLFSGDGIVGHTTEGIPVGVGLHDSSSALIPYLQTVKDPFLLLSTGTWCISLNPFNDQPLTDQELAQDCLCYLTHQGRQVKASRLFGGHWHQEQVARIATHFKVQEDFYLSIHPDKASLDTFDAAYREEQNDIGMPFSETPLSAHVDPVSAYKACMIELVRSQVQSTDLVLKGTSVKSIFVDGGFSHNPLYLHFLAHAYPQLSVHAAELAQASALGAALAIHAHWNTNPVPTDLIKVRNVKL
jgi:sugar (pentulose or hexulose) kinase